MQAYLERTAMLYGRESVEQLERSRVAVFGIGGVGGHALESLVRTGIGEVTIVDSDTVSETNLNRQIIATRKTVGLRKTEAAAQRIAEINPSCKVNIRNDFVLPENIESFPFAEYDYVIDAIDTVAGKLAIIKKCDELAVPCISAMGAGNKLDPTKFEVSDIYKTSVCPLAAVIRRECRRAGVRRLKVVYSREEAQTPEFQPTLEQGQASPRRLTPASAAFAPAVCGLIIASEVVRDLCKDELARSLAARSTICDGKGGGTNE